MKDWTVTIKALFSIRARNEEQAEERAQQLEDALAFTLPQKGWAKGLNMDSTEHEVEEA